MNEGKREFTRRSDRIEELVTRIESTGDPALRAVAQELLQAVIELHGVALDHIMQSVAELPHGCEALEKIAEDKLVSGVLSLHGIHPVPVEMRVAAAIENTRPYLKSHGGNVEIASIDNDTVHLTLQGTCGSCNSSSETLKSTVEKEIYEMAPEIVSVVSDSIPMVTHSDFVILQAR
jgi:Fe-S cluster biogenesis protein NfuA